MSYTETGSKAVLERMEAIRRYVQTEGRKKALRSGGAVIKAAMVEHTPILIEKTAGSTSLEPGEVKASIRVRMRQEDGQPVAHIGPRGGDVGKAAYNVEYGHRMVTGGRSRLNAAGVFDGPGVAAEKDVPAHPFLRPAFEESVGIAIEAVALSLKDGIAAEGI